MKHTIKAGMILAFFFSMRMTLSCFGAHPPTAPGATTEPSLGTYHWPNGTAGVDAFAAWLGRDAVWGLDFVGGESWSNIGWPMFWLEHWSKWVKAKAGRRLVLSIPILAGPVDGSGPKQGDTGVNVPVSLEKGAAGNYNIHFQQLAENLVKHGLADSVLRPAWEFNGDWYAWRAKGKTATFAEYWRQIVKTMRAAAYDPGTWQTWGQANTCSPSSRQGRSHGAGSAVDIALNSSMMAASTNTIPRSKTTARSSRSGSFMNLGDGRPSRCSAIATRTSLIAIGMRSIKPGTGRTVPETESAWLAAAFPKFQKPPASVRKIASMRLARVLLRLAGQHHHFLARMGHGGRRHVELLAGLRVRFRMPERFADPRDEARAVIASLGIRD